MKKLFKNTFSVSIMSFVLCFMLFIYESIVAYSQNVTDYWFDLKNLVINNLLIFIIVFVFLEFLNILVYLIFKKKKIIYDIYKILFFIAFVTVYIHGNYFVGSLPSLDGAKILWDNYMTQNIISIVLILLIIGINIFLYKKFKNNYNKIVSYTSGIIFAMLFVSFISVLLTNSEMYVEKGSFASTNDNINDLSSNKNLLVLLIDMVDSREFDRVIKENDKEEVFEDFTYFPDTLSTYGFTRDSIPFIFSGIWYEAQMPYNDYYLEAFDNSKLFNLLKEENFDINFYDHELQILNNNKHNVDNIKDINLKVNFIAFAKQELKYILFKYMPFPLKKYSSIETFDYNICKGNTTDNTIFNWSNKLNYDLIDDIDLQNDNYFHFLHIEGGHYPNDLNENMEYIENGTYDDKLLSAITFIEKYLNRIKKSGVYDNSAIIILSDHGYNEYESVGRQNPALFIKGFDEHHELEYSYKKVSYVDLNDSIYKDLLDGKKSNELLADISDDRIRRYLYYKDYDNMSEQLLDGHAWETDKLKNTGKKYVR